MREGIGKWKLQQCSSTNLLNEFVTSNSSTIPDDDDCVNTSSSAPDQDYQENFSDSDDDWVSIVEPPSPDRKCRFVNHERKKPIKPHFPSCPIQNPKNILTQRKPFTRIDTPMETPKINENSILARKLIILQNELQNLTNKKQIINERISYLHRAVRSLICQDAHYKTIGDIKAELH